MAVDPFLVVRRYHRLFATAMTITKLDEDGRPLTGDDASYRLDGPVAIGWVSELKFTTGSVYDDA